MKAVGIIGTAISMYVGLGYALFSGLQATDSSKDNQNTEQVSQTQVDTLGYLREKKGNKWVKSKKEPVYSIEIDNYFLKNNIPFDSANAYPWMGLGKAVQENAKDITTLYKRGVYPHVAKKYANATIENLIFCSNNNIGPDLFNAIPGIDRNKEDFVKLMQSRSAETILTEYNSFMNVITNKKIKGDHDSDTFFKGLENIGSFIELEPYFDVTTQYGLNGLDFGGSKLLKNKGITPKIFEKEYAIYLDIITTNKLQPDFEYTNDEYINIIKEHGKISSLKKYVDINLKYNTSIGFNDATYFKENNISVEKVMEIAKNIETKLIEKKIME